MNHVKQIITLSVVIGAICVMLFPAYKFVTFYIPEKVKLDKCPFCLGKDMCSYINAELNLSQYHFWINMLNILLDKPLIFGSIDRQTVVLKWVQNEYVDNFQPLDYTDIDSNIESMRLRINQPRDESLEDFLLCPTTENLGDFLKPILVDGKNHQLHRPVTIELHQNIIYTLQADRENLVQQVTQQWAVAPYLGACGVVSVSEYCGPSLTSVFSQLTWKQRSSLAVQLLTFAFNATFDNKAFAFYFTDLTPDNFGVSDSNEIRLVDLDNVIVVDKDPSEKPSNWDSVHTSYHDQDIHGFAFSKEEICSHKISDTNVYSICQGILSPHSDLLPSGLLHSPPPHLSGLKTLLDDCIAPPAELTRFDVAQEILQLLQNDYSN